MTYVGSNLGLETGFEVGQDGWGAPYNDAMRRLDALTNLAVLEIVEELPGSPANGDRYLLSGTAAENPNKVAVRVQGAWEFYAPPTIRTVFVLDPGYWMRWVSGAWQVQGLPTHTHSISQISGLVDALAAKADLSGGKLLTSQLPDLAIVDYLGSVASQSAMLALTGQKGDWCSRSDVGKVYVITGSDPTNLSSWTALTYPTGGVPASHASSHEPGGSDAIDWSSKIILRGTLAARPSASSVGAGVLYLAIDDNGGTLYRSTGTTWEKTGRGATESTAVSNYSPFIAPASANSDDDEFAGSYTWTDFQSTSGFSATVGDYGLKITAPNAAGANRIRGAMKSVALADGDRIYTHLACQHVGAVGATYLVGGMALVQDTASPNTTDLSTVEIVVGDTTTSVRQSQCADWQTVNPGTAYTLNFAIRGAFLMISRSGTTYTYWVSLDGFEWARVGTQTSVTHNGVLLFNHNFSSGSSADVYFRFFRRSAGGAIPIARRA